MTPATQRPTPPTAATPKSSAAMRVVQDLKAKGVHPDVIGKAIGETYSEVDEQKLAREFAERKRLKQPRTRSKQRASFA